MPNVQTERSLRVSNFSGTFEIHMVRVSNDFQDDSLTGKNWERSFSSELATLSGTFPGFGEVPGENWKIGRERCLVEM